jgi:uncharacterized protein (DUF58 family)
MALGAPPKFACAQKLAALFCYLANTGGNAVALASFDNTVGCHVALARGSAQAGKILASIAGMTPDARSDLERALIAYGSLTHGPGIAIVISDFFDERAANGLRFLLQRGLAPCVIQVIAPEELEPPDGDAIELVDAESPDGRRLVVGRHATNAYRRQIDHELQTLTDFCAAHGLPRLLVTSSMSFADFIQRAAAAGLLATRK